MKLANEQLLTKIQKLICNPLIREIITKDWNIAIIGQEERPD